jgi:RNA-binding protein YlmH
MSLLAANVSLRIVWIAHDDFVELVEKYKKGTRPSADTTQEEVDLVQELLSRIDQTKKDLITIFSPNFKNTQHQLVLCLQNVADAMNFNNFHEGIHLGVLMSIRKSVSF